MPEKMRSILVGMGGVSGGMSRILQTKPWHQFVGVVDVRDEALDHAGETLSLPKSARFKDLQATLDTIEADTILINTPSELHYAQTKAALEAGVSPLVAKPITNNYEEAVELVELAREKGVKLCVGQQVRFFRHYLAVRQFIESGQLGQIEQLFFFNSKPRHKALNLVGMTHPALYEMSCHHFDSIMSLFPDAVPESIVCDGFQPSWSVYDGPCMINGIIRFSGDLHALYHGGFSSQSDCYEVRLEGTKGVLRCRGLHMSKNEMTNEFAPRGGDFSESDMDNDIPITQPWDIFFDRWYDYLNGGEEPSFSGRNNLKVFALLSAAIDSIQNNCYVDVANNPRYANAFQGAI
ncbi:MAG: Gfo/Idh/MocA family oxidoreductase [Chloroflexota bacterium]